MLKRKLNTLCLIQKIKLINEIEQNPHCKKKDLALKYGIPANTLSTILKNKETILKRYASKLDPSCKRVKTCAFPDIEAALFEWFSQQDSKTHLTGVRLKEKAMEFARLLNIEGFTASAGWLEKFKARHRIMFWTQQEQANDIFDKACIESEPLMVEANVDAVCDEIAYVDSDEEAASFPTIRQAEEAVYILQQYLENCESVDKSLFSCVHKLSNFVKYNKQKKSKC